MNDRNLLLVATALFLISSALFLLGLQLGNKDRFQHISGAYVFDKRTGAMYSCTTKPDSDPSDTGCQLMFKP